VPAQVAAFPDRARQLVRNLGHRIAEEVAKEQRAERKPDGKTPPTPPPRPVRLVRATEVASVTRVSTEQEWHQLNAKLDQRVRQLLAEGFDVELG
jgi:hypothetical protein